MRTLVILVALFSIIAFEKNSIAQEDSTKTYQIEFDWQNPFAAKKTKTIKDYFFLLPSSFIDCEGAELGMYSTFNKREKLISKLDLKNGYLQFNRADQLVLFKDRKNKIDIVAIQAGGCGAGSTCGALNTLLELKNNVWKFRVDLLPKGKMMEDLYYSDEVCPYFDLPQYGTTILVKDEYKKESIVAKYLWNREKFLLGK